MREWQGAKLRAARGGRRAISGHWGIHLTGVPSSEACPGRPYLGELSPRPAPMTFSYRSCSAYVNSPDRANARRTANTCSCPRASVRGLQRTEQPAMVTRWPAGCKGVHVHIPGVQQSVCLELSGAGPTARSAPWTVDGVRLCPCPHLRRRSSPADVPDNVSESHTALRPSPGPRHASRPDVPDNRPLSDRFTCGRCSEKQGTS